MPCIFNTCVIYVTELCKYASKLTNYSKSTNSTVLPSSTPAISFEQKIHDKVAVDIPKKSTINSIRLDHDGYWKKVELLQQGTSIYLAPGKYKVVIQLKSLVKSLKIELDISDVKHSAFIHSAVSPNFEHVYAWGSIVDKSSPEYKIEKLTLFCTSASTSETKYSNAQYPDYSVKSCVKLAKMNIPEGNSQLGYFNLHGINMAKNESKGLKLLQQAYDLGHLSSGEQIAQYQEIRNNDVLEQAKILANKGSAWGEGLLAYEYIKKESPHRDLKQAKAWALKAVKSGTTYPMKILVDASLQQDKVAPNYVEAMAWVNVFLFSSNDPIELRYEGFVDDLAGEMSIGQIQQAKDRTEEIIKNLGENYSGTMMLANIYDVPDLLVKS